MSGSRSKREVDRFPRSGGQQAGFADLDSGPAIDTCHRGRPPFRDTANEFPNDSHVRLHARWRFRLAEVIEPLRRHHGFPFISRAQAELGFCPCTDLEQGLRRYIEYYVEQMGITDRVSRSICHAN